MAILLGLLAIVCIVLIGLGAFVKGLLWLLVVGAILLVATAAFGWGQLRRK